MRRRSTLAFCIEHMYAYVMEEPVVPLTDPPVALPPVRVVVVPPVAVPPVAATDPPVAGAIDMPGIDDPPAV